MQRARAFARLELAVWWWRVGVPLSDMTDIDDDGDEYNAPEYGGVDDIDN